MTKAEGDHLGTGNHPGATPPPTVAATPNGATARLTPRLREALGEVGRYEGRNRLYWWRVRSMMELEVMGLVETWRSPSLAGYRGKQLPYRITAAGRAALADADQREVTATGVRQPEGLT